MILVLCKVMEDLEKHAHGKKVLGHIGTMHSPERSMNEEVGHHHGMMGEHEKKALEGKKHYHI